MRAIMIRTVAALAGLAAATGAAAALQDASPLPDGAADALESGLAAMREREFETAIDQFDQVLDEAKNHPEANYFTGLAYAYLEDDKKAEKFLKRAVKARATFLEARERLALVHLSRGDPDKAKTQLESLMELREGCAPEICDEAYVDRADRAIRKVEDALAAAE
ncbi:MAG: hypothetical protein AAFX08_10735 [Pseudomonadota bacterium]